MFPSFVCHSKCISILSNQILFLAQFWLALKILLFPFLSSSKPPFFLSQCFLKLFVKFTSRKRIGSHSNQNFCLSCGPKSKCPKSGSVQSFPWEASGNILIRRCQQWQSLVQKAALDLLRRNRDDGWSDCLKRLPILGTTERPSENGWH